MTLVHLVPELCYITGLTDTMRSDMKVMKDVAQYTRISPAQRHMSLKKFISNVKCIFFLFKFIYAWVFISIVDPLVQGSPNFPA